MQITLKSMIAAYQRLIIHLEMGLPADEVSFRQRANMRREDKNDRYKRSYVFVRLKS